MAFTYSPQEFNRRKSVQAARERRQKQQAIVADYKRAYGCRVCGENSPEALDFHHRDPSRKLFTIAQHLHRVSLNMLYDEIAKCDILCASCHRKHHHEQDKHTI